MNMELLENLLSLCRGHGSIGERAICGLLHDEYGMTEYQDDSLNALAYVKVVGLNSPILWSSHIDTVHSNIGAVSTTQEIFFDATDTMLAGSKGNTPLGADCGAGLWLMVEMIEAGVPGTYVFHRGEECGGIGSTGMAAHWPDFLKTHTHAIAFDRRGSGDVITHQFPGRTCSEAFATHLCDLLNTPNGFDYSPSDGGTFTDTANYVKLIPECTNVSVGYQDEHSARETLDIGHLIALRDKVIEVFAASPQLPVERKVTDEDDDRYYGMGNLVEWGKPAARGYPAGFQPDTNPYVMNEWDVVELSHKQLKRLIKKDPAGFSDLLLDFANRLAYIEKEENDIDTEITNYYDGRIPPGMA